MERYVDTFYKSFCDFKRHYKTPELSYFKTNSDSVQTESRYIAGEIRSKLHELVNVVSCPGMIIYYRKTPVYILEFMVFYISFLKSCLQKMAATAFDVRVNVFLSPFKKVFPRSHGDPLTPLHVNSGVTYHNMHDTIKNVIVYRKEEVFKVLMHELIHAYELDISRMSEAIEMPIRNAFGKSGVVLRINESITDTLACMLNVIMYCILKNQGTRKPTIASVEKRMSDERQYILKKGNQVFAWEGYRYQEDRIVLPRLNMYEHTHVTSYYIIKAMNFWNINRFLDIARPYDETIYIRHIESIVNDSTFWKDFTKSSDKSSSLRMSKTDINDIVYAAKNKLLKTFLKK